jgi:hypothetical protein
MATTAIKGFSTAPGKSQQWIDYNQTGNTINASYNVASVADTAAGLFYVYPIRIFGNASNASITGMRGSSASNDLTSGVVSSGTSVWGQRSRTATLFTDSPNFYMSIWSDM